MIRKIVTQSHGNDDINSAWATARKGCNTHLLIRFGFLSEEELDKLRDPETRLLPKWFDPEQMDKLEKTQASWWDETHRKCVIGGGMNGGDATHYVRLPRNKNGKIDIENGTYDDADVCILKVKFDKEVRLCLGCAMIENDEGKQEGLRAAPYDYSGQTILSIVDYGRRQKAEIDRVRALDSGGSNWVIDSRQQGAVYEGDSVRAINKIGIRTVEKLKEHGIETVGALKTLGDDMIQAIAQHADRKLRISDIKLKTFRSEAEKCIPGAVPEKIDYRKAENPYLAKYGEDAWELKVNRSTQMSQYACITDLIEHIVAESAKLFEGTKHEDDWVFYHDALSLMTANERIKWMKEKDIYKRWILPVNGLHTDNLPYLKQYLFQPVGNSPENMPWDTSLNQDLHKCVERHISLTYELSVDDKRKFDMSTPVRGAMAYKRILEYVPTSERICHDVNKVFESVDIVRKAGGKRCHGVGNSNYGKRHQPVMKKESGGARKRKLEKDDYGNKYGWVHPDAKKVAIAKMEHSLDRTEGKKTKPLAQKISVD